MAKSMHSQLTKRNLFSMSPAILRRKSSTAVDKVALELATAVTAMPNQ
jgi:hypothetical protein